jgi:putative ABC transport system permease protein
MNALDRKAVRDLWHMKGQAAAIALVIASGVAAFIMSVSTLDSLQLAQALFYRDYRFAEVFADLKRAPESLRTRIESIPGVQTVETRVRAAANLDVAGWSDPVTALIVSVPDRGQPALNRLFLRQGRLPDPSKSDEAVISEAFAKAHGFQPGDSFFATINGRRKRLRVSGVALCPEFIYQLQPGALIPDFKGYGILWMARTPLESAFDMKGAFNSVTMTLSRGARAGDVLDRLDDLLRQYGGLGAAGRKDQISHRYLSEEFRQLKLMATVFPLIFLGVAAFLLNVVMSRLLATQREQVAILKAFGYANLDVVVHYLKVVVLIVIAGCALGLAFGWWLGRGLSHMYLDYYRFPYVFYDLRPAAALTAAAICAAAAVLGAIHAVIRAASLPPAEAMQPAPPARYRVSIVERLGLRRLLSQPSRMIVRNIERRPLKAFFTVAGTAMACAILINGGFWSDAVDFMVNIQFRLAQRDDLTLTFTEPTSSTALHSLAGLPGVQRVEPFRAVPARLRFEQRSYRTSIQGLPRGAALRRVLDKQFRIVDMPPEGIMLTDHLAGILGIRPGEMLTVEVLEGEKPVRQVPVAGLVSEFVGVYGYMDLESLNRLMREGSAVSGAFIAADQRYRERIFAELKRMPRVAGASVSDKALANFYEIMARQMLTFAFFNTLLASTIAFGVVYNSARIAFSERSRELASLRVLGFTRGEISYILLGELAVLTLAALPLGCWIGYLMCAGVVQAWTNDLFRIPLVIRNSTYSFAAAVVLISSLVSGLLIQRKLNRLDLVAVLKMKE